MCLSLACGDRTRVTLAKRVWQRVSECCLLNGGSKHLETTHVLETANLPGNYQYMGYCAKHCGPFDVSNRNGPVAATSLAGGSCV